MSGNWEDIFDQYLQGYAPREEAERLSLRIDVPASQREEIAKTLAFTRLLDEALAFPRGDAGLASRTIGNLQTIALPPLSREWGLETDPDAIAGALLVGFLEGTVTGDELELVVSRLDLSDELADEVRDAMDLNEQLNEASRVPAGALKADAFLRAMSKAGAAVGSRVEIDQLAAPVRMFPGAERDVLAAQADAGEASQDENNTIDTSNAGDENGPTKA